MKKFLKVSIVIVLTLALASTVFGFAFIPAASGMAGGNICPTAGWNSRVSSCTFGSIPTPQGLAFQTAPGFHPQAGWNS